MPMDIREDTYYRMSHVTGPGCVLVSLRFGNESDKEPIVTYWTAIDVIVEPSFSIDEYVQEVLDGVSEANHKFGGGLTVSEISIVPDDFPNSGQVKYCAFCIAEKVIKSA